MASSIAMLRSSFRFLVRLSFSLSCVALGACSSGGAGGVLLDGGALREGGGEESAATSGPGRTSGTPEAKDYSLSCEGLCTKAADSTECDPSACEQVCDANAQKATTAECDAEWRTYLACAVGGGKVTGCQVNGRVTVTRCDDERSEYEACVNRPRTCITGCKSDSECAASCPAAPNNGVNCCDISSGVCYASSSGMCSP